MFEHLDQVTKGLRRGESVLIAARIGEGKSMMCMGNYRRQQMEREEIEKRVRSVVRTQLGVEHEDIKLDSEFVSDLGADSLDTVELVMAIEEDFEIWIPDEEAERITNVRGMIDYLAGRIK